jgi:hypothetical protein
VGSDTLLICTKLFFYHYLTDKEYVSKEDDFQSILENGISFGRGGERRDPNDGKVKTKAKKKKYITGAHGSGSARQKAKYREQRANRKH